MEEQLRRAASEGNLLTVRRILQQPGVGFNVNEVDENDWTALHNAAYEGHLAIVQAILQANGVNVDPRTLEDCTPLHYACSPHFPNQPQLPIIQALLDAGADPNAAYMFRDTPLHMAIDSSLSHPCSGSTAGRRSQPGTAKLESSDSPTLCMH